MISLALHSDRKVGRHFILPTNSTILLESGRQAPRRDGPSKESSYPGQARGCVMLVTPRGAGDGWILTVAGGDRRRYYAIAESIPPLCGRAPKT